jgi:hypothetical protein
MIGSGQFYGISTGENIVASKYEEMILEGRRNTVAQGRSCATIKGKKLGVYVDQLNETFRIQFDGHVLSIPFEIVSWLSPNIEMLYRLAYEEGIIEEWWADVDRDEE